MNKIVLEAFSEGDGYYKIFLAYLNKEQVEEIKTLVSKWKPTDEDIINCIGMCLTDVNEQRFKDYGTNLRDCLAWLEKQGEQKSKWTEEDERMMYFCISRIKDELESLRNNKFAHQEILQDCKEGCWERIDWLKSLKKRMEE